MSRKLFVFMFTLAIVLGLVAHFGATQVFAQEPEIGDLTVPAGMFGSLSDPYKGADGNWYANYQVSNNSGAAQPWAAVSYNDPENDYAHQTVFQSNTGIIEDGGFVTGRIELPCDFQADLVFGDVHESLEGNLYGDDKMDWRRGSNPCPNCTPTPEPPTTTPELPTTTPEPPTTTPELPTTTPEPPTTTPEPTPGEATHTPVATPTPATPVPTQEPEEPEPTPITTIIPPATATATPIATATPKPETPKVPARKIVIHGLVSGEVLEQYFAGRKETPQDAHVPGRDAWMGDIVLQSSRLSEVYVKVSECSDFYYWRGDRGWKKAGRFCDLHNPGFWDTLPQPPKPDDVEVGLGWSGTVPGDYMWVSYLDAYELPEGW